MIYSIFFLIWVGSGVYNFIYYYNSKKYKYLDVSDVLTKNELLVFSMVTGLLGLCWNLYRYIISLRSDLCQLIRKSNNKDLSIKEISEIIGLVQYYLYEKQDLKVIDCCLQNINDNTSIIMGVTLVRSSFRFKNDLNNWTLAVQKIKQTAIKEKQNYKSILEGLL